MQLLRLPICNYGNGSVPWTASVATCHMERWQYICPIVLYVTCHGPVSYRKSHCLYSVQWQPGGHKCTESVLSLLLAIHLSHSTLRDVPWPRFIQEIPLFVWCSMAARWSQMYRKCSFSLLVAYTNFLRSKYQTFIPLVYSKICPSMGHKYLLFFLQTPHNLDLFP